MKKKFMIGGAILIAGLVLYFISTRTLFSQTTANRSSTGKMQVQVVDGMDETPIADATIVIPEINQSYTTDEQGKSKLISVPILQDEHFNDILPQPWGEVTLIIYKNGYLPYALFYTQVWASQTRQGPKIYLFKESDSTEKQPFGVIEGPQRLWVNELVEKYAPTIQ